MTNPPETEWGQSGARPPGGSGRVTLVGTAHVSEASVEEVREAIDEEAPDVVAVELDRGRYRQLQGEKPEDLTASDLLEGNTVFQLLAYWLLSYVQARLGDRFDIEPGADMQAAIDSAGEHGIGVALVDRDIQTTIQRFWSRLTFLEKGKLFFGLIAGLAGIGFGEAEEGFDPDELTDTDVVTAMIEELRHFSPGGAEALIDERDAYIAHNLLALREQGYHVVAVVGAGHREGIAAYLEHPERLPAMTTLTGVDRRRFSIYRAVGYAIALAYIAFFFLLAMAGVRDGFLLKLFVAWFLFNGTFAFILAKLAGARWTSAGVGGCVAWLTSLNPLLAPGWFAGYVELRYRPVNIDDIGLLNDLMADSDLSFSAMLDRMMDVPLFRLIAIVALTNIGSMIATFLFPFVVLPYLAADVGGVGAVGDRLLEGARTSLELLVELIG